MKILIADDDPVALNLLKMMLQKWNYEVVHFSNGSDAWKKIQSNDSPSLLILDRQMPGYHGEQICKMVREQFPDKPFYIILITGAAIESNDVVEGIMQFGADDYVTKPFIARELQARVQAGIRILNLEITLANRVKELENALTNVKQLQGLLPICSYCKKIRDDKNYWSEVESYITRHSDAKFSHGVCPDCVEKYVKPELEALKQKKRTEEKD
ncbi:MAG: response regulator transcription factor [Ignavibacteriales bacterium]|nr:response regulator transcription factor [Ignavibacteriales bacterium]